MGPVTRATLLALALALPAASAAAPQPMTREEILDVGRSGVGYSYWWGNGCWRTDGASHGSCSGGCPDCSHSGSYGADCSGFVAKAWQVPGPSSVSSCSHPYSTYNFVCGSNHWSSISRGSVEPGDALAYRRGGCPGSGGHVALYERGDPWGSMWLYEARGCSYGIVHNLRSLSGDYEARRRDNLGAACAPVAETCNGGDDDCDGEADEGDVCLLRDELLYQAAAWDTGGTSDIDGDGTADVCARAAAGIRCYASSGAGFGAAIEGPALADANGWGDDANHATIRTGDLDGDGRADLCARANAGIRCWRSTGAGFGGAIEGPELADAAGWDDVKYFGTIRLADVTGDGKDDLCARSAAGFACWPSTGEGFGPALAAAALSDENGWGAERHHGTIRMGDVDGDGRSDVCARGAAGVFCWLAGPEGFGTRIGGPAWSDEAGWGDLKYWSTIRLADVDGDGRADVCGRSASDFRCHVSTGDGFGPPVVGPALADESGWGDHDNFSTIRMGDVDGDGRADVCARANAGLRCWLSNGGGFSSGLDGPEMSDEQGWGHEQYHRTLRLADVNADGRADACARAAAGLYCWLSDGGGFPTRADGPAFSNESGWGDPKYYTTIRIAGGRVPPPACTPGAERCNGADDDCDGVVDEDGACEPPGSGGASGAGGAGGGGSNPVDPGGAGGEAGGAGGEDVGPSPGPLPRPGPDEGPVETAATGEPAGANEPITGGCAASGEAASTHGWLLALAVLGVARRRVARFRASSRRRARRRPRRPAAPARALPASLRGSAVSRSPPPAPGARVRPPASRAARRRPCARARGR